MHRKNIPWITSAICGLGALVIASTPSNYTEKTPNSYTVEYKHTESKLESATGLICSPYELVRIDSQKPKSARDSYLQNEECSDK